jgi:hypothetical protein
MRTTYDLLIAFILGVALYPQEGFGQHKFPQVGAEAPDAEVSLNAGQHSTIMQVQKSGEAGNQKKVKQWDFSLISRSQRVHPATVVDSIVTYKTALKQQVIDELSIKTHKSTMASPPVISTNFEGNWSVTVHPPDNNLAISNAGDIVSVNNDGVEYYDESGNLLYLDDWSDFINDNSLNSIIYDPVVQYDSQADRFVMAVLHGSSASTSKVIVFFSKSSDPMNGWHVYQLSGNPLNDNSWFDYPKLGISGQEIYITGNLYDPADNFNQSIIYQVEKSQGYAGGSLNWQYWFNLNSTPFPAFTLVPTSYGHQGNIGPGMLFVSTRPGGENRVRVWQLTDYINNSPSLNSFVANVSAYSPAGDGFMPNTSLLLDNGDNRILHAFFLNDEIHYVFNADINQGWCGIHYNRLNVNNLTNQSATLGNAGVEDYSFPVLASFATQTSDPSVMVSFLHSSQSIFPSTSVVHCNANMQWSQPTLIQSGTNYVDFLPGNKQRWGDYNGMARKHNSSTPTVWSATSFGTDIVTSTGSLPNTYKTWIAKIVGSNVFNPELETGETSVKVYPNPASDLIQVDFVLEQREKIKIELYDLGGKLVKLLYADTPRSLSSRLSFNRGALTKGQYLLTISNQNEVLYTEKVLVD